MIEPDLPKGWTIVMLGELVQVSGEKVDPTTVPDLPYLGLEHVQAQTGALIGKGDARAVRSISNRFRPGDVLYGKLRPYLNKVYLPDFEGICSAELLVLKPNAALDPEFLRYCIISREFVQYATQNAAGINLPRVSFTALSRYPISLPPKNEQRRIVARLASLTSRAQAVRAEVSPVHRLLNTLRQSSLAAAFRGDLTADWRDQVAGSDTVPTPINRWRGSRDSLASFAPSSIPESWSWSNIGAIVEVVRGASPRPAGDPRFFNGSHTPWITVGEITKDDDMYLNSTASFLTGEGRSKSRFIEAGTLLLTNSGATLGVPKITRIGGCINDGSVALLGVSGRLQLYLYFYLRSLTQGLRRINQGAAQPNLNTDIVRRIPVPLPPEHEIDVLTARLEVIFDRVTGTTGFVHSTAHSLELLESAILTRTFRGELMPQDPNDEPASVLLERIRAEKTRAGEEKPRRGRRAAQR